MTTHATALQEAYAGLERALQLQLGLSGVTYTASELHKLHHEDREWNFTKHIMKRLSLDRRLTSLYAYRDREGRADERCIQILAYIRQMRKVGLL